MEQVAHKEIIAFVLAITLAHRVVGTGDDHEFEILAGTNKGIGYLHGGSRVDVVVHLTYNEHEGTLQTVGILKIGTAYIAAVHRIAHPLFVPPYLVHAVVVTTTGGVASLVEVAMKE